MFRRRKFVLDDRAKQAFLDHVEVNGLLASAARHVGTVSRTIIEALKVDEEFSEAYQEALELYNDSIVNEIHRRAIEGVEKGVYYKGVRMDTEIVYSDSLLQLHAKANIEKYQDRSKQEVNITGGVLVAPAPVATAEQWLDTFTPKAELPPARDGIEEDTDERIIEVRSGEPVPA